MDLLDHLDGGAEYRQVGKAQEVHLQQTQFRDIPHTELRGGQRVRVTGRGSLKRQEVDERFGSDHYARRVSTGMAGNAFQLTGGIDQLGDLLVRLVQFLELLALLECLLDRHRPKRGWHGGHEAGDPVDIRIAHSQCPTDIANRRFGA